MLQRTLEFRGEKSIVTSARCRPSTPTSLSPFSREVPRSPSLFFGFQQDTYYYSSQNENCISAHACCPRKIFALHVRCSLHVPMSLRILSDRKRSGDFLPPHMSTSVHPKSPVAGSNCFRRRRGQTAWRAF